MHRSTQIDDGEKASLAGVAASPSSSGDRRMSLVIPFPLELRAAACALEDDASSLDEDVFELGELAVRLVGNFSLPRLLVVRQDQSQGAL